MNRIKKLSKAIELGHDLFPQHKNFFFRMKTEATTTGMPKQTIIGTDALGGAYLVLIRNKKFINDVDVKYQGTDIDFVTYAHKRVDEVLKELPGYLGVNHFSLLSNKTTYTTLKQLAVSLNDNYGYTKLQIAKLFKELGY